MLVRLTFISTKRIRRLISKHIKAHLTVFSSTHAALSLQLLLRKAQLSEFTIQKGDSYCRSYEEAVNLLKSIPLLFTRKGTLSLAPATQVPFIYLS